MKDHTPGPWKATESDPAEGYHVFWITAPQGCGPNNGEVDIVNVPGNKPGNAHLIAAAPVLLAAAQTLMKLRAMGYIGAGHGRAMADKAISALRATGIDGEQTSERASEHRERG